LVVVVIGGATVRRPAAELLAEHAGFDAEIARVTVAAAAIAVAALFAFGAVRQAIGLARLLAAEMIPSAGGGVDLGNAPRRALVVTLELAMTLLIGLPLPPLTPPL